MQWKIWGQAQVAQKLWMLKNISIQWKNSGQTLFFRASAKLLKNPEWWNIQYSEKFQGNCFSGEAQVDQKSWMKKYIKYSESRAHFVFQGKRKLLKNPECEKYIQYSEKFQSKLSFSGQVKVAQKSSRWKTYSIQWKISGPLCFSGQAQVAQNSWMIKNIYSIEWMQGTTLFIRASASCSKILTLKNVFNSLQWKISGPLCFPGQAQVAQKSWKWKVYLIQWMQSRLRF